MPTATRLPIVALWKETRVAEKTWRTVARQRISDQAPVAEQHVWWRLHDATKGRYASLDWRWQKTLLRFGVAAWCAALIASSAFDVAALPHIPTAFLGWRLYVVIKRLNPVEPD